MPKVKVSRKSTFIDMTAMSDVTVLLLTFFMLTSTFIRKEPVQVNTPGSVSEIKIPETDILQILVDPQGKIFLSMDKQVDQMEVLRRIGEDNNIEFTTKELYDFSLLPTFGSPIGTMKQFLAMDTEDQDKNLKDLGIPNDSTNNQFKQWVQATRALMKESDRNDVFKIAIKADATTPYPIIKKVMDDLRELRENRYNLITSLKGGASSEPSETH
ncbi:MAG: biopolymer transporter ExbD [Candidatus Azobacteroides sp.]|nr:biopolymer transporter ExbD [Candidatus Azobacteroides sp.]